MQDAIAAALEKKDFRTATQLLKQWQQQDAKNPKFLLMVGQYQEATDHWEQAEKTYLKILQQVTNPKLMSQARQGIQRVEAHIAQVKEQALATALAQPNGQAPGLMCLEPVQGEQRQAAAQGLAQVMGIDPYMARLQIPSRGWRLYRLGPVGELQYYSQKLTAAQTPAFGVKHADIKGLQVFRVQNFRRVQPQPEVICTNADGQAGAIAFDWSEVTQVILGQIPLFESVVDVGAWGKLKRAEKTQDYAEMVDLHCHGRRCILRLCDRTYDFRKGNPLPNADAIPDKGLAMRPQWQALVQYLRDRVPGPIHDGFTPFGDHAMEFMDLLPPLNPQIDLARVKESNWDPAFHLYSGLHFLRYAEATAANSI